MASSNQGSGGNKGNQGNQGGSTGNKQSDQGAGARGFASMDPDQQREIAAEGGRAAHAAGTAHEFTSEEARRAGSMSHKNDGNQQSDAGSGSRAGGGNEGGKGGSGASGGTRGGTPEQHAEAGRQSHKNDRK
ncbi:Stress-induced acidophilic repeat motif-containing protein [Duganella sp. CF517]|uniref:KGG domain-containing protein n=1 Tax=Duganella sp. CF517 TaxID=1881038 RepID=UPI0008B4C9BE|nr:KGG domain-containing protein [Duganella sp. CF517]SEO04972.1 Stress-induced acidophilic repeat motif-containing protein [Duganella sp. CF517]